MITTRITEQNVDGVLKNLKTTNERVRVALGVGLARGLLIAVGVAQVKYLSGPRPGVLDVVTTRLRGSITSEVTVNDNEITGRIGSNIPYAAYHEFGFHGVVSVRAHSRVTSLQISNGTARIMHHGGSKRLAKQLKRGDVAGVTFVKGHNRQVDYAGRPFLKPALEETDIAGEINKELKNLSNG